MTVGTFSETERRIKKLIERQKHEALQDQLDKRTKDIHSHVFYDYPLKPFQNHDPSIKSHYKSSPDIRTSSSKRSASVQTCPIRECIKKYYPSDFSTNPKICHSIILPSKYYQSICNSRRSVSASNLRRRPTCEKGVQVKRSPADPSRSMTNLPKEKLNDKLIMAAAERRSIAMNRESLDVTSCRKQHPAGYDKDEVRHFMKMQQVMSKRIDDVRPLAARKRPVDTITPTRPILQRSLTKTVIGTSDMTPDFKKEEVGKEFIVNRAELFSNLKSQNISNQQNNITRHRLSAKELKAMLDEILLQNVVKNCSIKLPKINNLIGKPILNIEEQSDDELPSLLKPKNVPSYDPIKDSWLPDTQFEGDVSSILTSRKEDSWLPDTQFEGDVSSILTPRKEAQFEGDVSSILTPRKEATIENVFKDTSICNRSEMENSFKRSYSCKYESSRHETSLHDFITSSLHERDRKEDTSIDRRQSTRSEYSKLNLQNSTNQIIEDESSFSQPPKVSFDDVFSNILERHRKEKSMTDSINDHQTRSNASSSNSDNTLQATNKSSESIHKSSESIHESSESSLSSLSDDSSSTCSGKSYSVTTEATSSEPLTSQSQQEQSDKEQESNSLINDLSITERINLIYSQRNISSLTDLKDEKSISSGRENHIKCLRITPEIDLDENISESPAASDEVDHVLKKDKEEDKEEDNGKPTDLVGEESEKPIKESEPTFVDEDKYEVSEEVVTSMVREICDLVVENNQVQVPDDWKWNVSRKYNSDHFPVQDLDHINHSMNCYRRFLCDLIESTMREVFRNGNDEHGFKFASKSIKSIAKFARKRPMPTSSTELFEAINPIILKSVGIKRAPKPSVSRDGILGYYKKHLDRDHVDVVALNEMIDEDDEWTDYDDQVNQLLDVLNENIFYSLLDSLTREVVDDVSPTPTCD